MPCTPLPPAERAAHTLRLLPKSRANHGDVHVAITCANKYHVDVYYARRGGVLFHMHYPASIMLGGTTSSSDQACKAHARIRVLAASEIPPPFQTEITFTRRIHLFASETSGLSDLCSVLWLPGSHYVRGA
eukprot:2131195-Pleurochrysis_carterae.AAC.1